MARIDDKIAATGFTITTRLSKSEIIAAADDAARRASGMVDKIVAKGQSNGRLDYALKRAGMASIGSCAVVVSGDDGRLQVRFVPGEYVTSQAKMLFIPMGPKESAALKPFQRFAQALERALDDNARSTA